MSHYQPGILAKPVPLQARHLFFALESAAALPAALDNLVRLVDGKNAVVGFGESLVQALGARVEGLRTFPVVSGPGVDNPSTRCMARTAASCCTAVVSWNWRWRQR